MSQVNIYDYKNISNDIGDVPILLHKDDTVYLVDRADIIECVVTGSTWVCGENKQDRGYRLRTKANAIRYTFNREIDLKVFTSLENAERKAQLYAENHSDTLILASDIKPVRTVLYYFSIGEEDSRDENEDTCIVADLGNGKYYIKPFFERSHFIYEKNDDEIYNQFLKPYEGENIKCIENYKPTFRNMYKSKFSDFTHSDLSYGFIKDWE